MPGGQGRFIHFQLDGGHGRIVHLESVRWHDGWPIIGDDPDGGSPGIPAPPDPSLVIPASFPAPTRKPPTNLTASSLGRSGSGTTTPTMPTAPLTARPGFLRLFPRAPMDCSTRATRSPRPCKTTVSSSRRVSPSRNDKRRPCWPGGPLEEDPSGLEIVQAGGERRLPSFFHTQDEEPGPVIAQPIVRLRVRVDGDRASYFYSLDDGQSFHASARPLCTAFSRWSVRGP